MLQQAINLLTSEIDTLIVIPNQKLLEVVDEQVSMIDGFSMINEILVQSVRGISDIITKPGHINVDFADVRTIMKDRGLAIMGTGKSSGTHRAREAALKAISSPLLENMNIAGVHGVLLNISGGKDLGLHEISEAASVIYEQAHEDANIIIGSVIDETLADEVIVTIIATGFEHEDQQATNLNEHAEYKNNVQIRATILDRSELAIIEKKDDEPKKEKEEKKQPEQQAAQKQDGDGEKEVTAVEEKSSCLIDLNDLDVPTFLRKKIEDDTNN